MLSVILFSFIGASLGLECSLPPAKRIDCFPESTPLTEGECHKRGCCFNPIKSQLLGDNVPWCFFPSNYSSYVLNEFKETDYGYSGMLGLSKDAALYPPKAINNLKLDVFLETPERLHLKITDPTNARYEVPIETPVVTHKTTLQAEYDVQVSQPMQDISIVVKRRSTGIPIFDTSVGPILFGDQFLQISTTLASSNVYGLGERNSPLLQDVYWKRLPFWALDQPPGIVQDGNLYGDHPFYMVIEPDGNAHGVFFLNSNAKEVEFQPHPLLTWRSIGGIMDFYIFMGPSPDKVIQQYISTIGHPYMPPLWSLGYHLCRWGYKTANTTISYVQRMRDAKIPQDVQWNDIDYMTGKLDFTYDHTNFDTLPHLVNDLHAHNQHYVMIIDPGISDTQPRGSYPPYDDALAAGLFVNGTNGQKPAEGQVWPGKVTFPDFTNPKTEVYWLKQLSMYHAQVPFDGVWIDMNEFSNFKNGYPEGCFKDNELDYPPYVPKISGGSLFYKTLCPSSKQYISTHYNVHSLSGLFEMMATSKAMITLRNKRPFIISRSTFPSAGMYGGHWTGDVVSTWKQLHLSIPSILRFNMFGVPLVGSDICGFGGSTNEELCIRWSQLGAFYPFSRNHNDIDAIAQAPVDFKAATQDIIRQALNMRYSFLPYLYTLFHYAHINGSTVARPLFFEFPKDENTYPIDSQFMWGSALLVTPVLTSNASSVVGYFPSGVWYDIYLEQGNGFMSKGQEVKVQAPLEVIPLHIRGGYIVPKCLSGMVTSSKNAFSILAALDLEGRANGSLYWDDGDSLHTYEKGDFVLVSFAVKNNTLRIAFDKGSYKMLSTMRLDNINVLGVSKAPTNVEVNGKKAQFKVEDHGRLVITVEIMFETDIIVTWS